MLRVGDLAPAFTARTTSEEDFAIRSLVGRPLILYFFHKAFTPNCTIETKGFRDNYADLREWGFGVVGVSTDSHETQCRFAERHEVTYPMIGDRDRSIARAYGVLWPLLPLARRVTYVLDEQQVILAVFRHEFQANKHLDEVLRFVRGLRSQTA